MSRRTRLRHAEAVSNAILGIALAQLILWLFGIPLSSAISMNIAMFAASYARALLLRILFTRIAP
jgi:phosphate/sulfate permease